MFRDRDDAGQRLARKLQKYHGSKDVLVLAVPRGGLVVGAVIARELRLALDIVLAKKLGHPQNSELAIAAVGLGAEQIDEDFLRGEGVSPEYVKEEAARVRAELTERYKLYRGEATPLALADKTVIVTDDGAATGRTLMLALSLVRAARPAKIVLAVPVASAQAATLLSLQADEVFCLETPESFGAIGQFYRVFGQISDEEAVRLLEASREAVAK